MLVIYKYQIALKEIQTIELPAGAKVLDVQLQGENICMWAIVNPEARHIERHVRIIGTGHPFGDTRKLTHIGTVQQGSYVWHVFFDYAPAT